MKKIKILFLLTTLFFSTSLYAGLAHLRELITQNAQNTHAEYLNKFGSRIEVQKAQNRIVQVYSEGLAVEQRLQNVIVLIEVLETRLANRYAGQDGLMQEMLRLAQNERAALTVESGFDMVAFPEEPQKQVAWFEGWFGRSK